MDISGEFRLADIVTDTPVITDTHHLLELLLVSVHYHLIKAIHITLRLAGILIVTDLDLRLDVVSIIGIVDRDIDLGSA